MTSQGIVADGVDALAKAPQAPRFVHLDNLQSVDQLRHLDPHIVSDIEVISSVLPFKVNSYVLDALIDWKAAPDDPIFRLVFPKRDMLSVEDFATVEAALRRNADKSEMHEIASQIRRRLNPHPAEQMSLNVPHEGNRPIAGLQHKYSETVLYFPSEGQTCHAYCTFCFRWAQFVKNPDLRIATSDLEQVVSYLKGQKSVTDLLITGGDPMVIKSRRMGQITDALISPELKHVTSIRFGTKALSYWPHRFVTDADADLLLNCFVKLRDAGKHVSIMAHFNHWRELEPDIVKVAIDEIRDTGAVIRSQSPLLRGINDDVDTWAKMWRKQVELGITPYYMFIARDTGARSSFDVPLAEAVNIYSGAARQISGLARTARGPVMSTSAGKVELLGIQKIHGEKIFVLRFIQARDPAWCYLPFFAEFDETATWFEDLRPAFGYKEFFFQVEFREQHC